MSARCIAVALLILSAAGCDDTAGPHEPAPDRGAGAATADEPFTGGKADGLCVADGTPAAIGLLALANDPTVSAAMLDAPVADGGVGLDRRAAHNIAMARPLPSLAALDAVPWVGVAACQALAEHACNVEARCHRQVEAMTWNLRHFPLVEQTPADVAEIIAQRRPAIIGIQEVEEPEAFDALLELLPGYAGVLGEPGPFTRVGIVYDTSVLQQTAVEHLFVDDWYAFPRPMLAMTAYVRGSREPSVFTFGVVHLKASPGARNENRRRNAVGKLRDWIEAERAVGHDHVMIVGDFNDRLTDAEAVNVYTELLDPASGAEFLTLPAAEDGEYSYIPFTSLLDHILVTDALQDVLAAGETEVVALDETWSEAYLDRVSDHRPVATTFDVAVRY